jgi:Rad3-related DNA helicase
MSSRPPRLSAQVDELLAPGGALALGWPRFEERPGQRSLAAEIARAMEAGGVLLAEAPTGIGKSLAYLLPAVLLAAHTGQRVVVATCTRSLQDQLCERDLPALLDTLGLDVPHVRLKGKQNYLCPRSLDLAAGKGAEEQETLEELGRWAAADAEGDLDRFPATDAEAFRRVRPRVATDPDGCTLLTCRRGRECFWVRARRRAAEARLLVVNHALLARSAESEGILPEFDVLVVDEAHRLEGVLLSQLERSVSRHRFEELLRALGGRDRAGAPRRACWPAPARTRSRCCVARAARRRPTSATAASASPPPTARTWRAQARGRAGPAPRDIRRSRTAAPRSRAPADRSSARSGAWRRRCRCAPAARPRRATARSWRERAPAPPAR